MKLNYKRTFLIGLVFFSIQMMASLHDAITPKILYSFGVGETLIGVIMAIDNILAIFMMPVFGWLSDRTASKHGKRTPYFVIGTIFAAIFLVLMPVADNLRSLPMFIAVLFLYLAALATYRSPGVSLMSDVTPKPLRSKANGIINLMGALASVIGIVAVTFLYKERISLWAYNAIGDRVPVLGADGLPVLNQNVNNLPMYLIVAGVAVLAMILYRFLVNENKFRKQREQLEAQYGIADEEELKSEKKGKAGKSHLSSGEKKSRLLILCAIFLWFFGYNAVITYFSNYAATVLALEGGAFAKYTLVANIAGIVSFLPAGMIATRIGRKKTIIAGIVILTAAFAGGIVCTSISPVIYLIFVLAGIGWATINVNSLPMIVEFAKAGNIGEYTGFFYFASMSAQTVTPIRCGALIEYLGIGYRVLFPYGTLFVFLAIIPMLLSKHGDSLAVSKGVLESFDVD
jgi:MFS family permease